MLDRKPVKVVLVGNTGVGKTAIALRINRDEFRTDILPTVGASFSSVTVLVDDTPVSLNVWDTAGQEKFRAMVPLYYRNASVAFIIYDVTDEKSFVDVKSWVDELRLNAGDSLLYIIGNKVDLASQRKVPTDSARQFAEAVGASFYETSALANSGISEVLKEAAKAVMRRIPQNSPNPNVIKLDNVNIIRNWFWRLFSYIGCSR